MTLEWQPVTAGSGTRSRVGQKSKDATLQVDVGHALRREVGNVTDTEHRAAEDTASRPASPSPVPTAHEERL